MLKGRYGDTTGCPYLEARIYLPRLDIHGDVSFLADTGADATTLMPMDAITLRVPFDRLGGDTQCTGVGGIMHCYPERAILVFTDPGVRLFAYDITIDIMHDNPDIMDLPSLLGRDILDRWSITFDRSGAGLVVNEVRSADEEINIGPLDANGSVASV